MTVVRMLVDWRGGGRANGGEWPPYGGLIDLDEWEAAQVIGGGNAELASDEPVDMGYDVLRVPHTDIKELIAHKDDEPEEADEDLAREDEEDEDVDDFDSDFDRDDFDTEVAVIKRPYENAKKEDWITFAASRGADRKEVAEMTKVQIIAKYGNQG